MRATIRRMLLSALVTLTPLAGCARPTRPPRHVATESPAPWLSFSARFFLKELHRKEVPQVCAATARSSGFERLEVPEDWDLPRGRTFPLRVYHSRDPGRQAPNAFVLVGGGPGETIEGYLPLVPRLQAGLGGDWDVVLLDTRGSGCSQHRADGELVALRHLTMAQTASDVHRLVRTLRSRGARRIVLAGGSSGAHIAIGYGVRYSRSIDLLYLDAGAAAAEFVNLSARLAYEKIHRRLQPMSLEELARRYRVESGVLFDLMIALGQRDTTFRRPLWDLLKRGDPRGGPMVRKALRSGLLREHIADPDQAVTKLIQSWRLYYVMACREILPARAVRYPYDLFAQYRLVCPPLLKSLGLSPTPYDYRQRLGELKVKTVIANGIDDYIVPFASSEEIYRHLDKSRALLVGFRDTGHVALVRHHRFVLGLLKEALETDDLRRLAPRVRGYAPAVLR